MADPAHRAAAARLVAGGVALAVRVERRRGRSPAGRATSRRRYFCAAVDVDEARPSGRILWLDDLRHAYVDLDDPTYLEFPYTQLLGDVVDAMAPAGEPIDAVHLGGGGFTIPRYVAATRPGSDSLVLELDPGVVRIAEDELGLELSDAPARPHR